MKCAERGFCSVSEKNVFLMRYLTFRYFDTVVEARNKKNGDSQGTEGSICCDSIRFYISGISIVIRCNEAFDAVYDTKENACVCVFRLQLRLWSHFLLFLCWGVLCRVLALAIVF